MQIHEHLIGANAENAHDFGMFRDMEDSGKTVGKMGRTVGNMVKTHAARSLEIFGAAFVIICGANILMKQCR